MLTKFVHSFFILLTLFFLGGLKLNAQNSDFRLRTGVKVDKDLSKKMELSFESQLRFRNNSTDFDKFLIEPAVKFELVKNFRLGAAYRYSAKQNLAKNTLNWHRANLFASYKKSFFSDWDVKMKTAMQYDTRSFFGGYNPKYNQWTNRSKVSLAYDFFGLPLSAEVGGEVFYNLTTTQDFEKVRLSCELSYEIAKGSKVLLQYLNDNALALDEFSNHILVVMYRVKIGR